ncbi:putative beta-glucosidase D [Aspergillus vadensis CBS 113365]|uniref:beta-glucosidase n=1 Tax=Aspergillus vadensis (strain CBS 113365 / IMI 142717 / IBT 24658) TaxID=1448311 RepID=A0A319BXN4_ASPVC|nr:putative beta-glucosidase D [Aspergillus vadensis CBS 113365]PYH67878.1 putative beta-glucosidase D [Aspergillus vadensis CBS 113365]
MKGHTLAVLAFISHALASENTSSIGILGHNGVDLGTWEAAYERASKFVAKLNTTQKVSIVTGGGATVDGETFPGMDFNDGSMGLLEYYYVSAFSQSSALSMTWDKDAVTAQARAVAREFYQKGVQVVFGPTSQPLGRTAWGGRAGETFGPDPFLNAIVTAETVKAYTEEGVVSQAKHFLLNEQETNRTNNNIAGYDSMSESEKRKFLGPYSANADDKTLYELYLWPFYDAVKSGLGSVMCAMNKVNGTNSCENYSLLMRHLKDELGFPGLVYPDVSAQHAGLASAAGGLDYGSSTYWSESAITAMLKNESLSMQRLNDMAIRNVIPYYQLNLDNGKQPATVGETDYVDVRANHTRLIREIGSKSIVLLKNERSALPLKRPRIMGVFGANAGAAMAGPNYAYNPITGSGPTYDGHLATGTGSGQASFPLLVTPLTALTFRALRDGTMLRWILNDTYTSSETSALGAGTGVVPGYVNYAQDSDVCLVFLNALAGEGADRTELYNSDQDMMVKTVADNCNNTVVVINTMGPRLVDQWIEHENVTAVLYSSLLGQESGNSILDVLYGEVNPSARLTYTIAKNESDYNVRVCDTKECDFTDGVYIDYRYFDAYNVTPRYEFGYGLSYTNFTYTDLNVPSIEALSVYPSGKKSVGGPVDLWDVIANVTVSVTNTGGRAGAEIPQLYLSYPESAKQPVRQLRGFERVELARRERSTVTFPIRRRDVSFWDVEAQQWAVKGGEYTFSAGASSRDLRLSKTVTIRTE